MLLKIRNKNICTVSNISSRVVSRADGGSGGWRTKTLCIKIGYSKPSRAESEKGLQP